MQMLLIRHGESVEAEIDAYEPLTNIGVAQSEKMAMRVSEEFPPEFIWSSPLLRASQTAAILEEAVGCPVNQLEDLREKTHTESKRAFRQRAELALSFLKEYSSDYKRIAIISHGGMITRMIESFLRLPSDHDQVWFQSDNTGIHFLEYHPNGQLVRFTNSTSHLI